MRTTLQRASIEIPTPTHTQSLQQHGAIDPEAAAASGGRYGMLG